MNDEATRRLPVVGFVAIVLVLLLVGVVSFYFWVKSTAVWGGVGTLGRYDFRPHRNKVELGLRNDLRGTRCVLRISRGEQDLRGVMVRRKGGCQVVEGQSVL